MNRPRRALILDTETTSLTPETGHIIEVAVILYDLAIGSPIASFAACLRGDSNAAEHINGIPVALLSEAFEQERVWVAVADLMSRADVILAHRAEFDKGFVEADAAFDDLWHAKPKPGPGERRFAGMPPWVCTKFHIAWPNAKSGEHLVHLALAYGVPVIAAHRALTDCDIIARLLTRLQEQGYDLQVLVGDAMVPRSRVEALVSFAQKDLAKDAGFAWDATNRRWTRECTDEEIKKLKFKTRVIG